MNILGIETSCDETSAAVIEANSKNQSVKILSNIISSSLSLHSKTGGIIPEIAAREQVKYIIPIITQAILNSQLNPQIDAIAVTVGPGLIGSLLVGVETARTLSYAWKKPIIPVNHLIGHIYANWLTTNDQKPKTIHFPVLALIVSGGHTDLVLLKDHEKIKWLGVTRDDAAGEALDKIGRLLGLEYPAGPIIERLAQKGNSKKYNFPRPMIYSNDFDFSFSGLKTAILRQTKIIDKLNNEIVANICASAQQSIIDVLASKTLKAAQKYKTKSILLGGGVAANDRLRNELKVQSSKFKIGFFAPAKKLCTDNAAMIASAAFFNYKEVSWKKLKTDPQLYFD